MRRNARSRERNAFLADELVYFAPEFTRIDERIPSER